MADRLAKLFGTQLKDLRKAHEDTKEMLAEKLSTADVPVTEEDIRNWEKGKVIPGRDTLTAICKLYGCEFYRLFGVKNEEEFRSLGLEMAMSPDEVAAVMFTNNIHM